MAFSFSCASNRLDPEPETFDFDDANLLADVQGGCSMSVPQFPRVAHLALLREILDDFGGLAHHHFLAGDDRAALRAAAEEGYCDHDQAADGCDSCDQRHTDGHAGRLRIEQDDGTDNERDEAAQAERAESRHMEFG